MAVAHLTEFIDQTDVMPHSVALLIAELFTPLQLAKNDFLLRSGQLTDYYFFLEEGYLRAFAEDTVGNEVTTNFYAPGQMVFEVASFFNRKRSRENIQALSECHGRFITYKDLNELFHTMPEFRDFGRAMLVKGFSELKNRMLLTITETAEERYAHLLKTKPEIFQQMSLKYIASYLGITDTSLSRIRKEFSKK